MSDAPTDHVAANRSYGGDPSNLQNRDYLHDALCEDVRAAIRALDAEGISFIKSKRIASHLGLEASRSTHRKIGKRLEELSGEPAPIVEAWSPGNGQKTWRIRSEHL